jgi:hypothetical protein
MPTKCMAQMPMPWNRAPLSSAIWRRPLDSVRAASPAMYRVTTEVTMATSTDSATSQG